MRKLESALLSEAIQTLSLQIGVVPKKVLVKNQKRRWGSCSSRGTINLNYRVLLLPQCLRDYVIIHELCHLREMNHSSRYWRLVESHCPDYRLLIAKLRKVEPAFHLGDETLKQVALSNCCGTCHSGESIDIKTKQTAGDRIMSVYNQ